MDRVGEGAADTVGNVLGALAAAPFAGDPVLSSMISGLVAPSASTSIKVSVEAFRTRNANAAVAVAVEGLNESIEQTLERIATDPRLMGLFLRTLRAAEATNQAEKILGLGRTLRAVLQDDALYDPEASVLRAMDRLEGPHLRLLAGFDRTPEEFGEFAAANGGSSGNHQVDALPLDRLEERSGLGEGTDLIAEELRGIGLLARAKADSVLLMEQFDFSQTPMYLRDVDGSVPVWYRTPMGTQILERMTLGEDGTI